MTVENYILLHFDETIRSGNSDDPSLISLPKSYNVPSIEKNFQELYYWDTYFTNKGLILANKEKQAINNLYDFVYLIDKFGYIPNGNRTPLLNRSQPPFFALAVNDVWNFLTKDEKAIFLQAIKKEYSFWADKRSFSNGLNRYDSNAAESDFSAYENLYRERVGIKELTISGKDILAECESGWDFSPRFPNGCVNYAALDLNCLLYFYENFLSVYDFEKQSLWNKKKRYRQDKILSSMRGKDGIFYDLDVKQGSVSYVKSCVGFFPYFVGIISDSQGFDELLFALEKDYGLIAAESDGRTFQWSAPNCWAPMVYVCVKAATVVGEFKAAERIALKYIDTIDALFEKEGKIFEKYNSYTGSVGVGESYGTPEMLGWTAGVYLTLKNFIERKILI